MLKKSAIAILILALVVICSACGGCEHEWSDATCTDAKKCNLCDVVEGEPLGHNWVEATYEAPKTCSGCGLTEGEPLENPAYAKDTVKASNAYSSIDKYIGFLIGKDRSKKYYEDERVVYFDIVLNDGAAEAYAGRGDNWGLYTTYIRMASQEGTLFFKKEGLEIPFHITVFDDRDGETVLYEVENGTVLTDVYADIVPSFLKTRSFESAFYTLHHNYDEKYEISAEYNEASGVLYFFARLDSATSILFNSLPENELRENNVWKSLTETTIRWSGENTNAFAEEGHEVLCVYMLIDGNTTEDVFFAAANGAEFFNFLG